MTGRRCANRPRLRCDESRARAATVRHHATKAGVTPLVPVSPEVMAWLSARPPALSREKAGKSVRWRMVFSWCRDLSQEGTCQKPDHRGPHASISRGVVEREGQLAKVALADARASDTKASL